MSKTFEKLLLVQLGILLVISLSSCSVAKENGNVPNPNRVQVKVIVDKINIRSAAMSSAKDIGDVKLDEIYNLVDNLVVKDEKYEWYHILTSNGIDGYIASEIDSPYVKVINGELNPPEIHYYDESISFENEVITYDHLEITDESDFSISHVFHSEEPEKYIIYKVRDKWGNVSEKTQAYTFVYSKPINEFPSSFGKLVMNIEYDSNKIIIDYTLTFSRNIDILDVKKEYFFEVMTPELGEPDYRLTNKTTYNTFKVTYSNNQANTINKTTSVFEVEKQYYENGIKSGDIFHVRATITKLKLGSVWYDNHEFIQEYPTKVSTRGFFNLFLIDRNFWRYYDIVFK